MKTALHPQHLLLKAKMVDFASWEMPIYYQGILPEHQAVRQHAGLFDVSHMGRILVTGEEAEPFLDYLSTNVIAGKPNNTATYTVWCNAAGTCVDDVIIYKQDATHFFVIVNASNRQKDLAHVQQYASKFQVHVQDRFQEEGILALQGPAAQTILNVLFPKFPCLAAMHFMTALYHNHEVIISATGYTGAGGVEIYAPNELMIDLWCDLLTQGKKDGLQPIGLGARDTLRLEMGYALYGHELSDTIRPVETVSNWTVKATKHDFLGKAAQQAPHCYQHGYQYGIVLIDKGIAREGYEVFKEDVNIGRVTSGTFSPSLQKAIALIYSSIPLKEGEHVSVKIRQSRCIAKVTKLPFLTSI